MNSSPLANQISSRDRSFDDLKIGDTVKQVDHLKATQVKVVDLDARTVILYGGRAFDRATGNASDGSLTYITND
jgi:hypothetical protein